MSRAGHGPRRLSQKAREKTAPPLPPVSGNNIQSSVQLACQACFQQFKRNQKPCDSSGTTPHLVSKASAREEPFPVLCCTVSQACPARGGAGWRCAVGELLTIATTTPVASIPRLASPEASQNGRSQTMRSRGRCPPRLMWGPGVTDQQVPHISGALHSQALCSGCRQCAPCSVGQVVPQPGPPPQGSIMSRPKNGTVFRATPEPEPTHLRQDCLYCQNKKPAGIGKTWTSAD